MNALRAISETAVAIRVWSCTSKPSKPLIWRAFCRAATTSRSSVIWINRMRLSILRAPRDHHRDIIPATGKVAIKYSRDDTRVLFRQTRVSLQMPICGQTVGMQNNERITRTRIDKLLNAAHRMADDALVRHRFSRDLSVNECPGNISDSGEGNRPGGEIDPCDRHCCSPRRTQCAIHGRNYGRWSNVGTGIEGSNSLLRRLGGGRPVAQAIDNDDKAAIRLIQSLPGIPADVLSGSGLAHRADLELPAGTGCRALRRPHTRKHGSALSGLRVDIKDVRLTDDGAQPGAWATGGGITVAQGSGK